MIPRDFPEANKSLTKPTGQDDVGTLRVYNDGHTSISCWHPGWRERFSVLIFGRVWLRVRGGITQPPVCVEGCRTVFTRAKGEGD